MLLDDDGLLDLRPRARGTDAAAVVLEEARLRREAPAENASLRALGPAFGPDRTPAAPGACATCGQPAKGACASCGASACASHRWTMLGLCTQCATEERIARWHHQPKPEERNWLEGGT